MIYTLIISLLIEKPYYLLSPQSFSFQTVSEFIDMFVKFSHFMSQGGGAFNSLFCLERRVLYTIIVPGGGFLLLTSRVPGGMVMDEIDACITHGRKKRKASNSPTLPSQALPSHP